MKKIFKFMYFAIIATVVVMLAVSCDNSTKNANDNNELTDAENVEDPDVNEKDEEGAFITAGGEDSGDKNSEAEGDAGNTGDYGEEPGAGDDSAEREIVESDIYKIEDDTIWVVNRYKGLIAIDMSDPKDLKIVGKAPFQGVPGEMYLQEGRAFILVTGLNGKDKDVEDGYYGNYQMSRVLVINTEDSANLKIIGEYDLDGSIVDSRQVGDVIYVVASQNIYRWYWCDSYDERGKDQISIMSLNIADPENIEKKDEAVLDGNAYTIYVSTKSIYVAEANWDYWNDDNTEGYDVTLFDISDPAGKIVKKDEFKTDGFMSDRWKMHEVGDVFYAVSTSDQWGDGDSVIESFDISDPEKVARIDKFVFMSGQQLYGTRFEGDRAYAVTYFRQDPLHVIDISDPADLKELGQLEIPGWSTHLEIRGTKILAVGIDDQDGWKTKVSMFDVADPEKPTEMSMIAIGSNYSYSEANSDWKAFKIFDDLGLILLPVNEYEQDTWRYMYRLYLIDFDLEKGLTKRGYVDSDSQVMRGVAIGDDLIVSIGDRHVQMIDAKDRDKPEIISKSTLAYYVTNLDTCGDQLCAVDSNYYSMPSTLVTYEAGDDNDPVKWRSKPSSSSNSYGTATLLKATDKGYMFNSGYDYYYGEGEMDGDSGGSSEETAGSVVKIFKFSGSNDPEEIGNVKLEMPQEENSNYYYYGYNSSAVTDNGVLAFTENNWDYYYPENDCYEYSGDCEGKGNGYGINLVDIYAYDLSDPTVEKATAVKISVKNRVPDYDARLFADGNTLWHSQCERKGLDEKDREILYCYAVPIDMSKTSEPKIGKKINIPGKVIGLSKDGQYMYTSHLSWRNGIDDDDNYYYNNRYIQTLYILKFNSDKTKVSVVKRISVPNEYEETESMYRYKNSNFIVKDKRVFVQTSETTYHYEESTCSYWYYSNRDTDMNIQIYRAEDGMRIFSQTYVNGSRTASVENGGFLISIEDNEDSYYGYSDSNEMVYISSEGIEKKLELTEKTYGYYSYSLDAAVIGDDLYVARDWNGIEKISLK